MIKKIAFDIDGTIADTPNYIVTSFMNCYNLEFGHPYTGKIVWTSPEIRDMFPDCQRDYIDKWENEHMWNREYYLNVPCRPGVKKLFDWLHKCNVEIHIITARHPEPGTPENVIEECTKEWCKRCGLDVDSFHIGFANKDSIVASHGIEIMVEDNYDISVEVAQKIPVILIDTEYNKKVRGGNIFHLKPTELDPVYFKKMLDYIEDHINNDTIDKTEMTTNSDITVSQITKDIIILKPKVFSKNVMLAVPLGSGDNLSPLHDLMQILHIKRLVDLSHLNSMQDLKQDSFIRGIILSEKMSEADVFTIPENTTAGYIAKTELIKKIIRRAAKLGDTIVYGAELALLSRDDAKEFKKYTMMFTNPSENDKKIIMDGKYKVDYDNFRILEDLTQATDGTTYKWRIIKDTALHELKDYRNRMYVTTEGVYDVDFLGNEAPYHPERFEQYVTMNTYLITDPHIGRNDMKKFNMMINNINSKVGPNDTLLVLGDWDGKKGSGGLDMVKKFCKRLKTRKILTLIGNNDPWEIKDLQKAGGFLAIDCKYIMRHNNIDIIFSHCPININRGEINIHGHMHGSCNYWNIDWHNHVDVWDENFNPITVADAIDLIRTGKYKAKSTIHDFR